MSNLFSLKGKTIFITGGAGLLGSKHAEAVVEYGGRAIIADIDYSKAKDVSDKINAQHSGALATPCYVDITKKESVELAVSEFNKIDVLINNAALDPKVEKGLQSINRFENIDIHMWQSFMSVSLEGAFLCSQVVSQKMLETDVSGVIINIASDLGVIAPDQRLYRDTSLPEAEQPVKPVTYSVAKWGLIGLTKYLSTYFADKNIRVNSLSPGGVYNDQLPKDFVGRLEDLIPLHRMANINDYKGAIVFLCSNASSYMTGHNLIIDGGRSVW